MKTFKLEDMIRGWFVGSFEPTAFNTEAVEVGLKKYEAGFIDKAHYHKVSTEITVIASGEATINGKLYIEGDIIVIEPNEVAEFKAITDVSTVVVKLPHTKNDKYEI